MTSVPSALDTLRSVANPEGVELELRLAGSVARAYAWLVDFVLRLVALFVAWLFLLLPLGGIGAGAVLEGHRGTAHLCISFIANNQRLIG